MDVFRAMQQGGLTVMGEKVLPTVSAASTQIFGDAPEGCCGVLVDFTGGDLTYRCDGGVVTATTGIILRAADAPHILPYARNTLTLIRAIGGSVTSGYVQYLSV